MSQSMGKSRLRDRTTSDLLVLLIAGTICGSIFLAVVVLVITSLMAPEQDHPGAVALVSDTLQMLVSLLAGFIAGRTESTYVRTEPGSGR